MAVPDSRTGSSGAASVPRITAAAVLRLRRDRLGFTASVLTAASEFTFGQSCVPARATVRVGYCRGRRCARPEPRAAAEPGQRCDRGRAGHRRRLDGFRSSPVTSPTGRRIAGPGRPGLRGARHVRRRTDRRPAASRAPVLRRRARHARPRDRGHRPAAATPQPGDIADGIDAAVAGGARVIDVSVTTASPSTRLATAVRTRSRRARWWSRPRRSDGADRRAARCTRPPTRACCRSPPSRRERRSAPPRRATGGGRPSTWSAPGDGVIGAGLGGGGFAGTGPATRPRSSPARPRWSMPTAVRPPARS